MQKQQDKSCRACHLHGNSSSVTNAPNVEISNVSLPVIEAPIKRIDSCGCSHAGAVAHFYPLDSVIVVADIKRESFPDVQKKVLN